MNNRKTILTNKRVGRLMFLSAILMMLAILHHPHGAPDNATQELTMKWVHGCLIFLMVFNAFGLGRLIDFFKARGNEVSLGLLFYYMGLSSFIAAALVSGFVQTALLESFSSNAQALLVFNKFSSIVNQALAKLGVMSFGASGIFYSPVLVKNRGVSLWVGAIGCVVGITLILSALAGLYLSVLIMTILTLLIIIWHVAIACWLIKH